MDRVRIALIGCGGFAGVHASRLKEMPECQIVALNDVSSDRLESFLAKHFADRDEKPATYLDLVRMLDESAPDAVVVSTPHAAHFEQGMLALSKGCHVLMEKPMVVGSVEAEMLAEKVKSSGKVFVVGYNTPCTEPIRRIRDIVNRGDLGRLEVVSGFLTQDWKGPTTGSWRQDPSQSGGGQMLDSGAHLFASLVYAVDRPFERAFAITDTLGAPVEINGAATILFEEGVIASIAISGNCACDGAGLTFVFEGGRIEADGWGGSFMRVHRKGEEPEELRPKAHKSPDSNFVAAILGKEQPIAGVDLGTRLAALMEALYASAATGQPVSA